MDHENQIISQQLNNLRAPSQNDGFLQKGRRRSKKDKVNRNYICGCGKTYLSYPALYTHIKNKHDSKAPTGTIVQSVNRPKKQEKEQSWVSKSNAGKSEKTKKVDNTSQIGDEEDYMKGALKDGHVVNKAFVRKEPFNYQFGLEDFDLVNFLGFQGTCEPEYSFFEQKDVAGARIKSINFLKNMKEYLELKIKTLNQDINKLEMEKNSSQFSLFSPSPEKPEDEKEVEEFDDFLVLQTRKRAHEEFETKAIAKKPLKQNRRLIEYRIKELERMNPKFKKQLSMICDKIEKMNEEQNEELLDIEDEEDALMKQSGLKKHPLFFEIKKSRWILINW